MVTVAHIVKKIVNDRPLLAETLKEGIISYGALAEKLLPEIESELGKRPKRSAVIMALRRLEDTLRVQHKKKHNIFSGSELIVKSGIADIVLSKSASLAKKIERLYAAVDFEKGGILNMIQGNNEFGIITNEKNVDRILSILGGEEVLLTERGLALIGLSMPREYLFVPGPIFEASRQLTMDNINIYEIVSTSTELIFIVGKKDAVRAYNSLERLTSRK